MTAIRELTERARAALESEIEGLTALDLAWDCYRAAAGPPAMGRDAELAAMALELWTRARGEFAALIARTPALVGLDGDFELLALALEDLRAGRAPTTADELASLGRAAAEFTARLAANNNPATGETPKTLADTGQIYVSAGAAESYARYEGVGVATAARELTEYLCDAKPAGQTDTGAEQWRYRSRSTGLDISAVIVREGRLAVVASVNVRATVPRKKRDARLACRTPPS